MIKTTIRCVSVYILILGYLVSGGCMTDRPTPYVINDFESDADLDRINWKCFTRFSLDGSHNTHGRYALKLELYPSDHPGLAPSLRFNDWRGYDELCFDMFNPQSRSVDFVVRIDDRWEFPDFGDRFNQNLTVIPGINRVCIPMRRMETSDGRRPLDLKNIRRFLLSMIAPDEKHEFYIDYIRLEVGQSLR